MRIEKCFFCSNNIYPGHGITFVRNDCKAFKFCRAKCHKNFKIKRNPMKVKWTKAFRHSMGKEMTVDALFDFENRRNTPVRYNRDLMVKTVGSMKNIGEIKEARQKRFWETRVKRMQDLHEEAELKEQVRTIHLVKDQHIKEAITLKLSKRMEVEN